MTYAADPGAVRAVDPGAVRAIAWRLADSLGEAVEPHAHHVRLADRAEVAWDTFAGWLAPAADDAWLHVVLADAAAVVSALTRWDTGQIADRLVVYGYPVNHPLFPGNQWARETVLGGALALGFALEQARDDDPDRPVPVPLDLARRLGVNLDPAWGVCRVEHERRAGAAAARFVSPAGPVRLGPYAGQDTVTLLGARTLRTALTRHAHGAMVGVLCPSRTEAWTLARGDDPAFAHAASGLFAPAQQGFPAGLLVTADEVSLPSPG